MFAPFSVMFHGTALEYHDEQLRKHNRYQHDTNRPVQLTENPEIARINAEKRAREYDLGKPVVLVVYTPNLSQDVKRVPEFGTAWGIEYLDPRCYLKLDLSGKQLNDLPFDLDKRVRKLVQSGNTTGLISKESLK